jgi:hypothetical protein
MLFMIFVVLLILGLLIGGVGHNRFGYAGWAPLGAVVGLAVLLYITGHLR